MKKLTLLACFVLAALLAGCGWNETHTIVTPSVTVSPTHQTTLTPIPPSPTASRTPTKTATPTAVRTPTPTQFQLPAIETRCLQTLQNPAPKLHGRIVLSGATDERIPGRLTSRSLPDSPSYILDLQTGQRIPLGRTQWETVSPDGSKLAYYDPKRQVVIVTDADGKELKEIPAPKGHPWPAYWLDNQHLILNDYPLGPYSSVGPLIIFDSLTGEERQILPEFPNQDHGYLFYWGLTSELVFNPALTHVVYPIDEETIPIILWDIQAEREVARLYFADSTNTPWWSPDGRYFITSANLKIKQGQKTYVNIDDGLPYNDGSELLLVSLTGEVRRLTYFTIENRHVVQLNYVWSPDGRKIAFLLFDYLAADENHHGLPPQLMVVDVETREVTNYCGLARLPETDDGYKISPPGAIWSPDGRYLVVTQNDENLHYKVFLVDLQDGSAWQIADNAVADGWMMSYP